MSTATCPNCGETPHTITVRPDIDEVVCACDYADDTPVCCEACGHEVDPDVAVLDGEQMVCPGCAEQGWPNAVDGLARHILGELAENHSQATMAIVNGERYEGELESLGAAYDRKREQLQQLGYDVTAGRATGWELALVTPEPAYETPADVAAYLAAPDGSNQALNIRLKMLAAERAATLPAGARVAVTFGPDAGQVGTVVRGPDGAGYYHVALDCGPDDWGPVWYFLPAEIALTTTPPAIDRPWANDAAYAAQGDR